MAIDTIPSDRTTFNRRTFLTGSVSAAASVPALALSSCAAPAIAAIGPIYSDWLAIDLAQLPLLQEFDFVDMFELMPHQAEYDALMEQIDETPANTFEEIAVKVLLGTIDGGGAWRDETLISAREDAKRLLTAQGLVPKPREITDAELEPLREGQRSEDERMGRLSEFRARVEEHGPERMLELMKEFEALQPA